MSGAVFGQQPIVRLEDQNGNPIATQDVPVTVALAGPFGALGGTLTVMTDAGGMASFAGLSISGPVGIYSLVFTSPGLAQATSGTINLGAGQAQTIAVLAGNGQSATVGTAVAIAPSVKVTDAAGNPVMGVTVTFQVASGSGSVTGTTPATDASGIATIGSWTLGTLAGANSLTATVAGLTGSPVTFNATATAGQATHLALVTPAPTTTMNGQPLASASVLQLLDAFDNPVGTANMQVTAAVQSGSGVLAGTTSVLTDGSGQATFTNLIINGLVGPYTLAFTSPGLTGVLTGQITLSAGAPAMVVLNGGDGQSASAGATLPVPPSVRVTDASGNPVSGVMVTFAVTAGGGSLVGEQELTDASGIAAATSWTLGPASGANTVTVTVTGTGVSGNPVTITAMATGNFWTSYSPIPNVLRFSAHGVYNGIIYIAAGRDQTQVVRRWVQSYNPATDTWAVLAPAPTTRVDPVGDFINGILYSAVGFDAKGNASATLEAYNPATNTWATLAPAPVARAGAAAAALNGRLYVVGGGLQNGTQTNLLQSYDPGTNSWSTLAPMPSARNDLAAAVVNGKLYAIGGQQASISTTMEVYDPTTNTWTTTTPMPTPRYHISAEVVGNRIYVLGGIVAGGAVTNLVEIFDPATGTWTTGAPMPTARSGPVTGYVNGILYAIAGSANGTAIGPNEGLTP